MASIDVEKVFAPVPSTKRNFTTHLSYDSRTDSLAYGTGRSAVVRSIDGNHVLQFTGHGTSNVTVVSFSPIQGSQYIASGDDSGRVIVWSWNKDEKSEEIEYNVKSEFQILAGPVVDISWDFEGKRLAVVGEGRDKFGAFISWDSGNSLGEVSGHSQKVNAVHFKQSRPMRAFSVSDDGSVVFYQGPPFKFSSSDRTHHGQGKFVRDIKFSPGAGKYAVSVGSDRKICCFDGKTGEFIKYIESEKSPISAGLFAVAWLDDGESSTRVVTVGADYTARLWDVESDEPFVQSWTLGDDVSKQIVGVAVTKDNAIAALTLDGTINILSLDDKLIKFINGHNKGITSLAVNPLVSGSYDGRIVTWNSENESVEAKNHDTHDNIVLAIDNSDNEVSSVSWDETLKNFINGGKSVETKYRFSEQPKCAAFSHNTLAVVTNANQLLIVDNKSGLLSKSIALDKPAGALALGTTYVAVGYEQTNSVQLFKISDLSEVFALSTPLRAAPSALSFSPSQKYLAAGDASGKIILYDLETKDVKTSRWSFHTSRVTSIDWRPSVNGDDADEDHVVTASLDTNIFIYSVKRPMKVIKKLNAQKDGVSSALWEDDHTIVSSGVDAFIKRWKVEFS
ncbi:unnamed protein product [Kluyveromyces dobzhanskii CBS 2104]|uniref:WGS project CCBQ000000000 data, contig 00010 n=1 Tax=Kluyveromyces dobzhanskii CBS 2104 TaxID=1427455 RepID=A0A0A8LAD0_9SACH|nr:unnamed protein product [Kluyveromyces dobzhanskii CBS 2104]